jgi:hypothetical protein
LQYLSLKYAFLHVYSIMNKCYENTKHALATQLKKEAKFDTLKLISPLSKNLYDAFSKIKTIFAEVTKTQIDACSKGKITAAVLDVIFILFNIFFKNAYETVFQIKDIMIILLKTILGIFL